MSKYLGIDTSNYTTSAAIFDCDKYIFFQNKKLLPVKSGEKGLRQSDAVFHHTVQIPKIITELFSEHRCEVSAVGVSNAPMSRKGSYMPCFLAGISVAKSVSEILNVPYYEFSHQAGHIAAVIAASQRYDLLEKEFIAFHLSGGTTQALFVRPDKQNIFNIELVAQSLDLKAGQAIDRAGIMLGLDFPCGAELDKLSLNSDKTFKIKPSMKGSDCSLSGIENKCLKMLENGERREDIAKFTILSVISAVDSMLRNTLKEYGELPILFSGGVSSNSMMQKHFTQNFGAVFTAPEFSTDNAVGTAFLTYLKSKDSYG